MLVINKLELTKAESYDYETQTGIFCEADVFKVTVSSEYEYQE